VDSGAVLTPALPYRLGNTIPFESAAPDFCTLFRVERSSPSTDIAARLWIGSARRIGPRRSWPDLLWNAGHHIDDIENGVGGLGSRVVARGERNAEKPIVPSSSFPLQRIVLNRNQPVPTWPAALLATNRDDKIIKTDGKRYMNHESRNPRSTC